jgi:hypothetical protein
MTARDFCRERGFAASSLFLWSSRLRREGHDATGDVVRLARVVRTPAATRASGDIVVERGPLRIRFAGQVDADLVTRVVRELAGSAP